MQKKLEKAISRLIQVDRIRFRQKLFEIELGHIVKKKENKIEPLVYLKLGMYR